MVSTSKSFVMKTLPLVLIVFTVFTISLSDNLQLADGFSASGTKLIFETNPGETTSLTWAVVNDETETFDVEFYAEGKGSEFFVFEKFMTLEPATRKAVDIFVIIPDDHPNNIEYHPVLYALKRDHVEDKDDKEKTGASIKVLLQMKTNPIIKIGANPVFTPEPVEETINTIPEETVKPTQQADPVKQEETQAEKLARIQEANKPTAPAEVKVDDTWEESFEEEPVPDYEPEPTVGGGEVIPSDNPPTYVKECNFIDWLLSLFGMAKC